MTIDLGDVLDLDDLTGFDIAPGRAQLFGDNIFYSWVETEFNTTTFATVSESSFAVYDRSGATIVAPQSVDPTSVSDALGASQYIIGASLNADGSFVVRFTANGTFATAPDQLIRSFAADGTPQGAATPLDIEGFAIQPDNSVTLALSTGNLAVAHPDGITVFGPDGAYVGGIAPAAQGFLSNEGDGYSLHETADGMLLIRGDGSSFNQSLSVVGQRYSLDGTLSGAEFEIISDITMPVRNYGVANRVDAAVLNNGNIVVTFGNQNAEGDADGGGVSAIIVTAAGAVVKDIFTVNDVTTAQQAIPVVHALEDGGFVITYDSNDLVENRNVFVRTQRFDADGNAIGDSAFVPQSSFALVPTEPTNTVIGLDGEGLIISDTGIARTISIGEVPADPPVTETGTDGNDLLNGASGDDTLDGLGGDDTLNGNDGADRLIGGSGDDLIFGGATAADLRDLVFGGAGNDTIDGGYGNDQLRGDAGDDQIAGGFGVDTVIGGTGNDTITGSAFSDLMFGGDGDDFVNGGFGSDRVNGGAGADRFYHLGIFDHGNDWIQDFNGAEDVLVFGGSATHDQFQINTAETAMAGEDGVAESFIIYRPTGQIMWALVDGDSQDVINLRIAGETVDLTL